MLEYILEKRLINFYATNINNDVIEPNAQDLDYPNVFTFIISDGLFGKNLLGKIIEFIYKFIVVLIVFLGSFVTMMILSYHSLVLLDYNWFSITSFCVLFLFSVAFIFNFVKSLIKSFQ